MLGFFDLEFKMDDINKHEPPLLKLDKVINWEIFRPSMKLIKIQFLEVPISILFDIFFWSR